MNKVSKKISWEIIKKSFFPVLISLSIFAFLISYHLAIIPLAKIPEQFQHVFKKMVATLFIASIAFVAQRIVGGIAIWYKENIALKTRTKLDDQLIPLFRRTLKIVIWVIGLLVILPIYGVNISALIAALGISSLAIALAAQDTIANIISGFMIMIDRPFQVGNRIKLPSGELVEVLDIGIRRSKFLAEDKAIIIVPNLELSKSKIINYTYGQVK